MTVMIMIMNDLHTDDVVHDSVLGVVRQERVTVVGVRVGRSQLPQVQSSVAEQHAARLQHSPAVFVPPHVRRLAVLLAVRRSLRQTRQQQRPAFALKPRYRAAQTNITPYRQSSG